MHGLNLAVCHQQRSGSSAVTEYRTLNTDHSQYTFGSMAASRFGIKLKTTGVDLGRPAVNRIGRRHVPWADRPGGPQNRLGLNLLRRSLRAPPLRELAAHAEALCSSGNAAVRMPDLQGNPVVPIYPQPHGQRAVVWSRTQTTTRFCCVRDTKSIRAALPMTHDQCDPEHLWSAELEMCCPTSALTSHESIPRILLSYFVRGVPSGRAPVRSPATQPKTGICRHRARRPKGREGDWQTPTRRLGSSASASARQVRGRWGRVGSRGAFRGL